MQIGNPSHTKGKSEKRTFVGSENEPRIQIEQQPIPIPISIPIQMREREREEEEEEEEEEEAEVLQLRKPYNSFTIAISITAWIIGTRSFLLGTF
jgi:hypothetical protein